MTAIFHLAVGSTGFGAVVSYFQRRLGMKTLFPGEPEQSGDVEYVQADPDDKA
jgi:hypothetical protein